MLEKYKKIYLKNVTFMWSLCAVVCIVPILITTIKYKNTSNALLPIGGCSAFFSFLKIFEQFFRFFVQKNFPKLL